MVEMIKRATGVNVVVGQNGLVWMNGEPKMELIVVNAIRKIEAEAHIAGLTDRMKAFLEEATGKPIPDAPLTPPMEEEQQPSMEGRPYEGGGEQREYRERREYGGDRGGFRGPRGPPRGGPRRFGGPRDGGR
jgi:exosome complex component RRP4